MVTGDTYGAKVGCNNCSKDSILIFLQGKTVIDELTKCTCQNASAQIACEHWITPPSKESSSAYWHFNPTGAAIAAMYSPPRPIRHSNADYPEIAVGVTFVIDGTDWKVKKERWFGGWRCEASNGQKRSFLEADIMKAIMMK